MNFFTSKVLHLSEVAELFLRRQFIIGFMFFITTQNLFLKVYVAVMESAYVKNGEALSTFM